MGSLKSFELLRIKSEKVEKISYLPEVVCTQRGATQEGRHWPARNRLESVGVLILRGEHFKQGIPVRSVFVGNPIFWALFSPYFYKKKLSVRFKKKRFLTIKHSGRVFPINNDPRGFVPPLGSVQFGEKQC